MSKIRRIAYNKWFLTSATIVAMLETTGATRKWS